MTRCFRGLALASTFLAATQAHADTTRDTMPQIYTMTPMGVNLQSGIFVQSETDFSIGSLSFVRSWRAVPTFVPGGGSATGGHHNMGGWNHNFGFGATWHPTRNDGVNVYADGKVYQFVAPLSGGWLPWNIEQHNNNAFGARLTGTVGSNLVFRNQAGDVYTMNASNQATRIDYADGTRVDLTYDSGKRLRTIVSNRGDAIVLDYNANGLLTAACGYNRAVTYVGPSTTCAAAPIKVTYGYSATTAAQGWVMSSVTATDGQVTSMTYDTYYRPNLTCITIPGSATCRITNVYGPQPGEPNPPLTRPDQVRRQTTATGELWTYFYLNADLFQDWPPIEFGEIRQTESDMTDPLGNVTHAEYENGFLKRLSAPEGLTQYSWASLNPSTFISPGGSSEILLHDDRHNLASRTRRAAPGSGLADIVRRTVYPGHIDYTSVTCTEPAFRICNRPLYQLDERGNQTDYTHDPAHGGVLTMTGPAPAPGAVRPQTRYAYSQIYAGVRNSGGALVNADTPVWVLTQESRCQTQASCTGTADEVRTLYEYGPSGSADALRLRGTVVTGGGVTSRTCYGYDPLGNRISETGPGAGLASCP